MAVLPDLPCPNCRQPAFSFWRRQIIGPTAPAVCPHCSAEAAVTWSSFWTLIPFTIIWLISEFFVDARSLYWGMNAFGLMLTLWLNYKYVPLIVVSKAG